MLRLHVVVTSTRPGRVGLSVAQWFLERAKRHGKLDPELVDLKEVNLPALDEPKHPRFKQYEHEHTKKWSAKVSEADAFAFVTPEYNYSCPPALLNAFDYLYEEWTYKPAGFVSYGSVSGGTRSVQMIKPTVTALKMMPLPEGVVIPWVSKLMDEHHAFQGGEAFDKAAVVMLDELARWAGALKTLRT
ncbi:MAG TPA: NAD(P)H-dependent oxidoreductase [Polyangiaceae bacterium]|jgi:NAD(P)H-dependent FMN reductase